jgi:hypothetical protein
MADQALDFAAYKRLHDAAEGAEGLLLTIREMLFAGLEPEADQRQLVAELVEVMEDAPQLRELRRVLGRTERLPPAVTLD